MAAPLSKEELHGVIPPVVSTFDSKEDLDVELFGREIEFMRAEGVDLVVVGGSTGEGSSLTPEELARLVDVAVRGGLRVMAGIITTTTRDAIRRAALAREAGAAALLAAPPIYVQPTGAGLESFLVDVGQAVELPIVFYNHFFYPASVLRRLAALPEIIGIKEAAVDVIGELCQLTGDEVTVAAGIDPVPLAGLAVGAKAVIAGVNAVIPRQAIAVFDAFDSGDLAGARGLLDRMAPLARLMTEPLDFPASVKFAINASGREVGTPRLPAQPLTSVQASAISDALARAGVADVPDVPDVAQTAA
jgi:4-hydroxy-tetrahydrodipicolinate synthase